MIDGCSEAARAVLPAAPPRPERTTVVFLGDSLTAGYGLDPALSFPSLIQASWSRGGIPYAVINEGVSGDTTADVLARLGSSRAPAAELTILEIGANDAFHGVAVDAIKANITLIIERIRRGGSRVALCTMYFSDGFVSNDNDYTHRFNALYAEVGRAQDVPVLPSLLRSLFTRGDLWQADGVHPTAAGHALVARDLLGDLNPEWKN
jgi:acyl-CoA thioesterase-1